MPSIQIPGSLCKHLNHNYIGTDSSEDVIRHIRLSTKAMIESAVKDDIPPARLPISADPGLTQHITFPSIIDRKIRKLAKDDGSSDADAARRFLYAAIIRGDAIQFQAITANSPLNAYVSADNKSPRPDQTLIYGHITNTLTYGKIGLIEGATGVGKSLAMIAAACEILAERELRAVIAAPSIQILRQFVEAHARLSAKMLGMPSARPVIGRQEFVSVELLMATLADGIINVDPEPIRQWLQDGGSPLGAGSAFSHSYLCASLQAVSPTFPLEVVRLTSATDTSDPGAKAYAQQFAVDEEAPTGPEIIYCTHAMVGVDIRRRLRSSRSALTEDGQQRRDVLSTLFVKHSTTAEQAERRAIGQAIHDEILDGEKLLAEYAQINDVGHLPLWQYLIIDEAHTFESNLASALANYISVRNFALDIRTLQEAGLLPKTATNRADAAVERLRNLGNDDDLHLNDLESSAAIQARAALGELADAFSSARIKKGSTHPLLEKCRQVTRVIQIAVNQSGNGILSVVRFSPIRAYPQLFVGRKSIDQELRFLWGCSTAVACMSATLYFRKLDMDTASYYRSILNIPKERAAEYPPIRPAWVTQPVAEVRVPPYIKRGNRIWLRPPTRSDRLSAKDHEQQESAWLADVAQEIRRIHQSAEGGTLILMTSYQNTAALNALLGNIEFKITAHPDHPLPEQKERFIKMAAAGKRPLWLAIGAAWTGLDINGAEARPPIPPEEDNLLTDLVIPRIPFSLNKTMTHYYRTQRSSNVPWELLDTAMRFKQGLGRIVRREGLNKNRRIHVLDGRINDPKFESYFALLNQIMAAYPRKIIEEPA